MGRRIALRDLDAELIWHTEAGWHGPADLAHADGLSFLCPKCFTFNSGPVGTHMMICWFVGKVPDNLVPVPGRWTPAGTGIDDLTFVPGDPPRAVSILLTGVCHMHGHIRGGAIECDR